jgi:uncharacterized protein
MTKNINEFQVFAKPIGSLCNLECRYCYYLNKHQSSANIEALRMPESLLEEYIVQHIDASAGSTVTFSWHGGEPTLLGLDFFRKIVALQRKHQPRNKRIYNGVQTNGILLDEEWCRFLSSEQFGVGLSLDGPAVLHDAYRVSRGGEPTHRQVLRAFEYLKRSGITCDILCAVHGQNVLHPLEVYQFFKEIGGRYIGFLPIVEKIPGSGSQTAPYSVPADAFGEFLCAIFDEWSREDIGRVSVQIFEEAIRPLQGSEHSLCIFRKTCGNIPVIEHNGDFFCCDHFVDEKHHLGNILETPFQELLRSREQRSFGEAKRNTLPRHCLQCEVLDMCNGGCPKDRFLLTPEGEPGLNYLCRGYTRFFTHCRPFFLNVVAATRARQKKAISPNRNDPCPCGSGKKYKKCCLGKKQNTEYRRQVSE